jgi:anthranilate phosphoribosyltransferase
MLAHDALRALVTGHRLTSPEAEGLFTRLLAGELDQAQIAGVLALIQARGVTTDELIGAARVMRAHVTPVPVPEALRPLIVDTCGTGGAPKTFNVSTAAAIIAAAAAPGRVLVAKHGNRSRTGRGSAEVLQTLGVNVDATPETQARCLERVGVCFCFAIHHHPAVRHASGPRKSLGFSTIFNLLGPLANPAGASRQLLGVYDRTLVEPLANTLHALGSARALVVHGLDGLDELTTTSPSLMAEVSPKGVSLREIDARTLGLPRADFASLIAADLAASASMVRGILAGERSPARDLALINAAAALVVGAACETLEQGLATATHALDRGDAARTLEALIHQSHASA